ncbi:speckle-type POZ protein-like [Oppia nitens]|uniref:speckle-type POZ protein-like n=1 Tax=Oppia nitens TaxID=1686743 RepID=UPI0023DBB57E|nr:speckle-type POZ protein-like [Oppia nitens]
MFTTSSKCSSNKKMKMKMKTTTNEVIIVDDDIDSYVFEKFLNYLYTGECDSLYIWYQELLVIADKYLVQSLKTMCLNWYYMKINGENALKIFQDFGADGELIGKTCEFIAKNVGSVFITSTTTMATTKTVMDNSIINKCKVLFKIDNFADQLQTDLQTKSTEFDCNIFTIESDKWQIIVHCLNDNIGLYLRLVQTYESSVSVQYDMYIVDSDNQLYGKRSINHTFDKAISYGFALFIKKQQLMDNKDVLLPDNALTVGIDMTVHKKNDCNRYLIVNDLFGIRELSDCRLVVGNYRKEFFVSKLVLSARSEVFRKMFTTDCLERTTNEVVIDDIESYIFEKFLHYLYTGECETLCFWYRELLVVADKYLVGSLKTICLNWYYMDINSQNAIETLKLFEDFGADDELMAKTYDFIAKNVGSVFGKLLAKDYDIKSESVSEIGYKIDKFY